MNHRPYLGLIALAVAIGGAILMVILLVGMPMDALAATPSPGIKPAAASREPGSWSLWFSGMALALWFLVRRRGE